MNSSKALKVGPGPPYFGPELRPSAMPTLRRAEACFFFLSSEVPAEADADDNGGVLVREIEVNRRRGLPLRADVDAVLDAEPNDKGVGAFFVLDLRLM